MKIRTLWIIIGVIFVILIAAYFLTGGEVQAPTNTAGTPAAGMASSTGSTSSTSTEGSGAPETGAEASSVNVYLIALQGSPENPGTGPIGCGDAAVAVKEDIAPTSGVLKAALEKLFSLKDQQVEVGSTTYYNALYQSDLAVESAAVANGVATVKLSGQARSGGVCDDPRIKAQLEETVMQFGSVKSADIFINGKTLDDYFSLK